MSAPAYHVEHLEPGAAVPAEIVGRVFHAAWRGIGRIRLEPGESHGQRELSDSEAMVYVTRGEGVARLQHAPVDLREGIALTLFKGERLDLRAGASGLEAFVAEIGTDRPAAGATD